MPEMMKEEFRITANVLGYREAEEHVALALEMDLRGYGSSFEEALHDLEEQMAMQLSFSLHKHGTVDMAMRPAESAYFERFAEAEREAVAARGRESDQEFSAASISCPSPDAWGRMQKWGDSRGT